MKKSGRNRRGRREDRKEGGSFGVVRAREVFFFYDGKVRLIRLGSRSKARVSCLFGNTALNSRAPGDPATVLMPHRRPLPSRLS